MHAGSNLAHVTKAMAMRMRKWDIPNDASDTRRKWLQRKSRLRMIKAMKEMELLGLDVVLRGLSERK